MAYWCDDRALDIEQRRLDAGQEKAAAAVRERCRLEGKPVPAWAKRISDANPS
jgi:hypothetical protein